MQYPCQYLLQGATEEIVSASFASHQQPSEHFGWCNYLRQDNNHKVKSLTLSYIQIYWNVILYASYPIYSGPSSGAKEEKITLLFNYRSLRH